MNCGVSPVEGRLKRTMCACNIDELRCFICSCIRQRRTSWRGVGIIFFIRFGCVRETLNPRRNPALWLGFVCLLFRGHAMACPYLRIFFRNGYKPQTLSVLICFRQAKYTQNVGATARVAQNAQRITTPAPLAQIKASLMPD